MSIFKCILWKSSSVFSDWRLLFYGGVPLQSSLLRSDFDVRLAGLSSGTGGHQSLTGVVPAFLPLPAQTDAAYLSDKSRSKKSHLAVNAGVSRLYSGVNF